MSAVGRPWDSAMERSVAADSMRSSDASAPVAESVSRRTGVRVSRAASVLIVLSLAWQPYIEPWAMPRLAAMR